MSALAWAQFFAARGIVPVPIPAGEKGPRLDGFLSARLDGEALTLAGRRLPFESLFAGNGNIGVVLGPASGGLVDVDLDDPTGAILRLAPRFLPATPWRFGRASKPSSHWLYRVDESGRREACTAPWRPWFEAAGVPAKSEAQRITVAELRDEGGQTMAPGSVHPCGEAVEPADGADFNAELPTVARSSLREAVARLSAAALLVVSGRQDDEAAALAGGPVEALLGAFPEPYSTAVRKWFGASTRAEPELPFALPETAASLADARAAYRRDRTPQWPTSVGKCPACKHNGCFKAVVGAPERWICYSTSHDPACGRQTDTGYSGDVIDIDCYTSGRSDVELLREAGYLGEIERDTVGMEEFFRGARREREEAVRAGWNADLPMIKTEGDQELASFVRQWFERDGGRLVSAQGSIWAYAPSLGIWRRVDAESIRNLVMSWHGAPLYDDQGQPRLRGKGVSAVPATFVGNQSKASSTAARVSDLTRDEEYFEAAPEGLVFADGFVRAGRAGVEIEFLGPDHRARFRVEREIGERTSVGTGQGDPLRYKRGATPDLFIAALERAIGTFDPELDEKVQIVREWAGLALLGHGTFGRALIIVGEGGSGKSMPAKALLGLFPVGARAALTPAQFDPGAGSGHAEYYLAQLAGRRINADTDLKAGLFSAGENFKKAVSGELITGRDPGGKPFTFTSRAAMLFCSEDLPVPDDRNSGFFRRWLVLRCNGGALDDAARIDKYERVILEREKAELASWLVDGAAQALERGRFAVPESMKAEVDRWQERSDNVRQYFREELEPFAADSPRERWRTTSEMYKGYREWAEAGGMKPLAVNKFGEAARRVPGVLVYIDRNHKPRWGHDRRSEASAASKAGW